MSGRRSESVGVPGKLDEDRTLIVLDRDTRNGAWLKAWLQQQGYEIVSTSDPRMAARAARTAPATLVLADLEMMALEAIPRWARRRGDAPSDGRPPGEGYAILRPLGAGTISSRYQIVALKSDVSAEAYAVASRFALVGYAPRTPSPALLEALRVALEVRMEEEPAELFADIPRLLRRALVVDPDATWREHVKGALAEQGFVVDEAEDSIQAFRLALAQRPGLILSEVDLPGVDGFELLARIRAHPVLARTPLAFVARRGRYEGYCYSQGLSAADEYLSKPVPIRELLIRVALMLKRHCERQARPNVKFKGGIRLTGSAGALQACHWGRLSGVLVTKSGTRHGRIGFRNGEVVTAECAGATGIEGLREFLGWPDGQFAFLARDPGPAAPLGQFEELLIEGARRLDELKRGASAGGALDPSREKGRSAATAVRVVHGGHASLEGLLAPVDHDPKAGLAEEPLDEGSQVAELPADHQRWGLPPE